MSRFGRKGRAVWPVSPPPAENATDDPETNSPVGKVGVQSFCSTVTHVLKKYNRSFKMVLLASVPIIALIICAALVLTRALEANASFSQVKTLISNSIDQVGDLVHRLQTERGTTVLYLASHRDPSVLEKLQAAYNVTDAEIKNITHWRYINLSQPKNERFHYFESKQTFQMHIRTYRQNLSDNYVDLPGPIQYYSEAIERIIEWFWEDFSQYDTGKEWTTLVAYQLIILGKEQLGVERALGGKFYAAGGYEDFNDYLSYMNRTIKGATFVEESMMFSRDVKEFYNKKILENSLFREISDLRSEIIKNNYTYLQPSVSKGSHWFQKMSEYIDLLLQIQYHLTTIINEQLEKEISYRQKEVIFASLLVVTTFVVSPFILQRIGRQTREIERIASSLNLKTVQLDEEKRRADKLLYQMLPYEIAEILKTSWDVAAEAFEEATIFFSDVVNFTNLCAECSPMQVVVMLNTLYQTLDTKIELYDVYKIETIGDAYVVVSGVPRRNGNRHVYEMSCLAIDIRDTVGKLQIPHIPTECFQLRIGLHTGPCAAGVVGYKMPRYCLFGDSVNTASRMESTGKPSKIHISQSTFEALQQYMDDFCTVPRGSIYVKGKGKMETFWLEGRKDPANHLNSTGDITDPDQPTVNLFGPNDANVTQVTSVIALEVEGEVQPYVTKPSYGYQVSI